MQALLSGCSAGGLASIIHCDRFRALFQEGAKVKCFSDAGYFINGWVIIQVNLLGEANSAYNLVNRSWFFLFLHNFSPFFTHIEWKRLLAFETSKRYRKVHSYYILFSCYFYSSLKMLDPCHTCDFWTPFCHIAYIRKDITGKEYIKAFYNDVVTTHVSYWLLVNFSKVFVRNICYGFVSFYDE